MCAGAHTNYFLLMLNTVTSLSGWVSSRRRGMGVPDTLELDQVLDSSTAQKMLSNVRTVNDVIGQIAFVIFKIKTRAKVDLDEIHHTCCFVYLPLKVSLSDSGLSFTLSDILRHHLSSPIRIGVLSLHAISVLFNI